MKGEKINHSNILPCKNLFTIITILKKYLKNLVMNAKGT